MVLKGEPRVYHVISRTALGGFALGDIEKDFLLNLIRRSENGDRLIMLEIRNSLW
jgi:hypothetical protein